MDLWKQLLETPVNFLTTYGLPFILIISVLVFVHEWGHYIIARLCGVRVETFSIGFGRELFGYTDKAGTRWKFSLFPLGGFVQMFGDSDPASTQHQATVKEEGKPERAFTADEKKVAFYTQPVGKRAAIVFAGPAINFIFAIVLLTGLYATYGQPFAPPIAAKVLEGSPAEKAGIMPDDKILEINGRAISQFSDIVQIVAISLGTDLEIKYVRSTGKKGEWSDTPAIVHVMPAVVEQEDRFGFKHTLARIGIQSPDHELATRPHSIGSAFVAATRETFGICADTLKAIGQMITGVRSTKELGGILRIGAYAGEYAQGGIVSLITFAALLSVNLGFINLLPIPMLDGGHLAFYAFESVRRKPMGERAQEYALRTGFVFLMGIMLFATWNDLSQLKVISFLMNLVS